MKTENGQEENLIHVLLFSSINLHNKLFCKLITIKT